jgi:shikimate kinase
MIVKSKKPEWMKTSIVYLVGFMGAGKTEVGRRLSELLGWSFVDLDHEIEKRAGIPISEIFRQHGEAHFRVMEREELKRVCRAKDAVVALGGGAFSSDENREDIFRTGIAVWLDVPLEVLHARCRRDPSSRPLFDTKEAMATLLKQRLPHYAEAQLHVRAADCSIEDLAHQVLEELKIANVFGTSEDSSRSS